MQGQRERDGQGNGHDHGQRGELQALQDRVLKGRIVYDRPGGVPRYQRSEKPSHFVTVRPRLNE